MNHLFIMLQYYYVKIYQKYGKITKDKNVLYL